MKDTASPDQPIVIKKYANRRLYNTASSSYVTLEDLAEMVKENVEFAVYDAKSGEDITRSVMTQIIFEQESRGAPMLPTDFLRQLIRYYGDNMQSYVPSYLTASMDAFAKQQDALREQFSARMQTMPMGPFFAEQAKQNMAIWQNAMQAFMGGAAGADAARGPDSPSKPKAKPGEPAHAGSDTQASGKEADIDALKAQMLAMQEQLAKLAGK